VSSIPHVERPPAGLRDAVASILASFRARWADYEGLGADLRYRDDPACVVPREKFAEAARRLRDEAGFDVLMDHTAVDYPDRPERFTVVAVLENLATNERLLLKTRVAEDVPCPSLAGLWEAANWSERETYDMFGIPFEGHPDLTRIYMPQDYEGWPGRRDFPTEGHIRFQD
jgi:NADH-quinone oxidoreductase subunit C